MAEDSSSARLINFAPAVVTPGVRSGVGDRVEEFFVVGLCRGERLCSVSWDDHRSTAKRRRT
jgi:hypothetical protein